MTTNVHSGLFIFVIFSVVVSIADARPGYVRQVPTRYSCDTCHTNPGNRNLRTGFGIDFGLNRGVWANDDPAQGICRLDSDGDGLTNGEELADPDCLWRVGDRLPQGPISNPANARDPDRCGDGVRQAGEACDGDDLDDATCEENGFMAGAVACTAACEFSFAGCEPFPPEDVGVPDAAISADAGAVPDALPADPDVSVDANLPEPVDDASVPESDDGQPPIDDAQTSSDVQLSFDGTMEADAADRSQPDGTLQERDPSTANQGGCNHQPGGSSPLWFLLFCLVLRRGYLVVR